MGGNKYEIEIGRKLELNGIHFILLTVLIVCLLFTRSRHGKQSGMEKW